MIPSLKAHINIHLWKDNEVLAKQCRKAVTIRNLPSVQALGRALHWCSSDPLPKNKVPIVSALY